MSEDHVGGVFPGQIHDIQPGDYEPGMRWRVLGCGVDRGGPHDGTRVTVVAFPISEVDGVEPTREVRLSLLAHDGEKFAAIVSEVTGWAAGGDEPPGTKPLDEGGHAIERIEQDGTVGEVPDEDVYDDGVVELGGGD